MSPRTVGLVDGIAFFVIWSLIGLAQPSLRGEAVTVVLVLLLMASALVLWRGAVLASLFVEDRTSLLGHVLDGAKWGAIAGLGILIWGVSSQVLAAGGLLDNASFFSAETAIYLLFMGAYLSATGAVVGGVHGAVLFYFNRWFLRRG
ncbi:hypothetical protein NJR55_00185 [Idiomarina sp. M1R2S28]|uniref:Uncharacterized protein n=1 Tax=Idiomarina rhizosphaerae TaxID=2961572 RepID=A0A9X2JRS8_9GAMM|nr:hypothetical protein [Idiomarina rhizosphaerae]MCP1337995.1 hypothetical protein [Idiomarina rhizosphaerae]